MWTIGHTLHLPWLALSVSCWSALYCLLRRLQPAHKAEWHCRLVTVVHASFICLLSFWVNAVEGPWPFTDAGGPNTALQVVLVTICLGYFLFDFSWCLYFQTEALPMLLHHFLSIFGMFFLLIAGRNGTEMAATIFGSELTNPLLQLRWFLKETGRYKTLAGEIVDFLFMTSFFSIRIVLGSYLLYCYFLQPTPDFWGRLGAVSIYLIGWMFWVSIFQYAVYKYGKMYRAWRKGTSPSTTTALGADRQRLLDEDKHDGSSLKSGQSDLDLPAADEQLSSQKGSSGQEASGKRSSAGASPNGVFHRNNGGPSPSKGAAHLNGVASGKDSGMS